MKKQFNPFPYAASKFGAPMGRHGENPSNLQGLKQLRCRRQGGGDGYDKGGAYWGLPSNVYAVWGWVEGKPLVTYLRAKSREHAIRQVFTGEFE